MAVFCITVKIWKCSALQFKVIVIITPRFLHSLSDPSLGVILSEATFPYSYCIFLFSRNPEVLGWMGKLLMHPVLGVTDWNVSYVTYSGGYVCLWQQGVSFMHSSFAAVWVDNFLPNKNSLTPPAFVALVFTLPCNRSSMLLPEYKHCFGQIKMHVLS